MLDTITTHFVGLDVHQATIAIAGAFCDVCLCFLFATGFACDSRAAAAGHGEDLSKFPQPIRDPILTIERPTQRFRTRPHFGDAQDHQ